jgi:hypothetical protein
MSIELRLLDIDKDRELFIEAYNWRNRAPRWFRECLNIWKESLEEYLENAVTEFHYGVWVDGEFQASIRLIETVPRIFNIHLYARRGVNLEDLYVSGVTLRDFLVKQGIAGFYGYLPIINKGISHLYECLGFEDTGIRVFKGVIRGRVVEWKHYALVCV